VLRALSTGSTLFGGASGKRFSYSSKEIKHKKFRLTKQIFKNALLYHLFGNVGCCEKQASQAKDSRDDF